MPNKRPTWQEKLNDSKGHPRVVELNGRMRNKWGTGTMVIPAPLEVHELMSRVPKGKLITINEIRIALAKKHQTTLACPLTTGIFAWISANAAEEKRQEGKNNITPYWRTLKTGGILNEKYPGGAEAQKQLLEIEGHVVIKKGKNYMVNEYLKALMQLDY